MRFRCVIWVCTLAAASAATAGVPAPAAPLGAGAADDPFKNHACVQCHRDLPGRSSQIVDLEWRHSVHYANSVGCDGCHGGDATVKREQFDSDEAFKRASHLARNPDFLSMHSTGGEFVSTVRGRNISYFCGRCHAEVKEKHLGSPHGDFGDPSCLYCHGQGSHKITTATPAIIDTRSRAEGGRCSACHAEGTMDAVRRIKAQLLDTEEVIQTTVQQYAQLEEWGYRNLELEKLTHHVEEVNSKLRRVFHSFNMREINNFTAEIQEVGDRTSSTHALVTELRQAQQRQMKVGLAAVVLLLSFAAMLVYYKHTFLEPHGEAEEGTGAEAIVSEAPVRESSHAAKRVEV